MVVEYRARRPIARLLAALTSRFEAIESLQQREGGHLKTPCPPQGQPRAVEGLLISEVTFGASLCEPALELSEKLKVRFCDASEALAACDREQRM